VALGTHVFLCAIAFGSGMVLKIKTTGLNIVLKTIQVGLVVSIAATIHNGYGNGSNDKALDTFHIDFSVKLYIIIQIKSNLLIL
jgi:hypothetical protein